MSGYHIAFWNLENLFAPQGFAGREPWLAKRLKNDLKGWTTQLFDRKLEQLSLIISQLNEGQGPDILGVCEVEAKYVLDRLCQETNKRLAGRSYRPAHVNSAKDRRGIDTAFLYDSKRIKLKPGTLFSHFVMRRTGTRDITQATFQMLDAQKDLVALCNHWPSRSGGTLESAGFRMTAGESLGYWHERIREEVGEDTPVIAFGDFNDDPFDPSVTIHARATRELGDVVRANSARFYNLSWNYLSQSLTDHRGKKRTVDGTLYFKGNGNVFDQIFASAALLKRTGPLRVRPQTARIEAPPPMVSHKVNEGPIRFGLPKGNAAKFVNKDGFSDHFPVSVLIAA